MSRTKRFLGGVSVSVASMLLTTIVGIWLARFLLLRIGQHDYGVWLVLGQITSYMDLLDLGVIALLARETAMHIGRGGSIEGAKELPVLIGKTMRIVLWQTPLVGAIGFVAWWLLCRGHPGVERPMLVIFLSFAFFFPFRVFHAVLEGVQDLRTIGSLGIVAWTLSTVTSITLVLMGMHIGALAAAWLVRQTVYAIGLGIRLRTSFPALFPRRAGPLPMREASALVRRGTMLTMQKLGTVFVNASDYLIVDRFMSASAVVPFASTNKAISVLGNLPRIMLDAARPGLSEARTGASTDHILRVCSALTQAVLLASGLFAVVTVAVNRGFVDWWLGVAQYGGTQLSVLIAMASIARMWAATTTYTAYAFGLDRALVIGEVIDGLVTVLVSAVLVTRFGFLGVPLGQIAGACLVTLPINLYGIARELNASVGVLVLPLWRWALRFALCLALAIFVAHSWTPAGFVQLVLASIAGTVIYGVVMLPIVLGPALAPYAGPRIDALKARFTRR